VFADDSEAKTGNTGVIESCAGLERVENRVLDQEERRRVRWKGVRLRLAGFGLEFLAFVALLAILAVFVIYFGRASGWQPALMLIFVFVFPAILFLPSLSLLKRGGRLRKVARAGYLRCFRGRIGPCDIGDPAVRALKKAKLLKGIDMESEVSLELLPEDDLLYAVNGRTVRAHFPIHVTRATPPPADAVVLGVPEAWFGPEAAAHLERRRLSEAEIDELLAYITRGRKLWTRTILLGVWSGFVAASILDHTRVEPRVGIAASLIMGGVTMAWYQRRVYKHRRVLRGDASVGWAIIHSPKEGVEAPVLEILPVSRIVWTVGGKPAGWRKLKKGMA
jgi:hypothetical protein